MQDYVITCCSTADLSRSEMEKWKLPFAMFHYTMDGQEHLDDLYASITPHEFYQKIVDGAQPTTSQVNVEQYTAMFEPILQKGQDILHITLSSGISGTYNSALIAQQEMREKYPDRTIAVVDSLSASSGYGLLVVKARENQLAGMSLQENQEWLLQNRIYQQAWFFSTDLTSYIRGGRISKTKGMVASMLSICPLLRISAQGKLLQYARHRGRRAAIQAALQQMKKYAKDGTGYSDRVFISQSDFQEDAETLAGLIEAEFPHIRDGVQIFDVGTVIGSHTGKGTVALFFWGREPKED